MNSLIEEEQTVGTQNTLAMTTGATVKAPLISSPFGEAPP